MFAKFLSSKLIRNKNNDDGDVDTQRKDFVYRGQSQGKVPSHIILVSVHPWTRKIKKMAFEDHPTLHRIVIPSNVKKIGWKAFCGCHSLTELCLQEGVTKIDDGAFMYCQSLTGISNIVRKNDRDVNSAKLTIPATVESIGWWAFAGCTSLVHVCFPESSCLERLDHSAFQNCSSLTHMELPRGLKLISNCVFSSCTSLVHIELPETLEEIGECVFENCISLQEISFPRAMARIGGCIFSGCQSLVSVEFQEGGPQLTIFDQAFCGCTSLSAIALPSTLSGLGFRVFDGCTNLLGVEVPPNCAIEHSISVFMGCKSLVNISLPASVVDEMEAFPGCELLEDYAPSLKERYDRFPVHQVCYNSTTTTVDDLIQALNGPPTPMVEDEFGMTAFHILATSVHPRVELLECLLDGFPTEVLCRRDEFGKTMMDYLLSHTSSKVVPAIQTVLKRSVLDALTGWDCMRKWELILSKALESIPRDVGKEGARSRSHMVSQSFFCDVGRCVRSETTSILELAIWKMRLDAVKTDKIWANGHSRQICRMQSCAEVVIENVAECLWNDESWCSTALSFFPLCSVLTSCSALTSGS